MKRFIFTVAFLFSAILVFGKGYETKFSQPSTNTYQLSFEMEKWSSKPISIGGTTYQTIQFDAVNATEKKGWAELPYVTASICINDQKPFEVNIVSSKYKDFILNHQLLPSRGVIYRDQDPSKIAYEVDPASIVNEMYPENLFSVEGPYIIRDVRGISVQFYPFQYNAATQTLRVYENITVEVTELEGVGENPLNQKGKLFNSYHNMYKSMFLNYGNEKDPLPIVNEYGDILIVTTARDEATLEPYIQWKKEKGFNVEMLVVATGTNIVAPSNNLVKAAYENNPNIMFVQVVGDWADVKCNQGGGANAPMDPMIGCVIGTDNFPDIAVGRFSCSNATQLTTQINKTINYEKTPDNSDWYSGSMHIASNEGSGSGDDGESDIQHEENIWNYRLHLDTYTTQYKHYQGQGGTSTSDVANSLTSGVSIANYTGHGSMTSWVTTGFSNSNINALTNGTKLPFIFSVACNNGDFHNGVCFAEAWLQKENGGAIAAVMASISQPWVPPMVGQDYFNDILTGGYDYTTNPGSGTSTEERRTIFGNIHVNGLNLMLQESQSSNLTTTQTWNLFGDASFQIRTAQPEQLMVSNTTIMSGTPYIATFTTNGTPVVNAQVCISQNDVYLSAFTDENGNVSIDNSFTPGEVLLVATAFNTTTIYQIIDCVPAEGSFLITDSYQLDDDGILSFGETTTLALSLKNVGSDPTSGTTTITLSSGDPMLTVSGTATLSVIAAGEIATTASAFTVIVSPNIENGQSFPVTVLAVCGSDTWENTIYLRAYKPIIVYESNTWQGSFTPGETFSVAVSFENEGGFTATNTSGILSSTSQYVTINNPTQSFGNIDPTGIGTAIYSVTIDVNCPTTEVLPLQVSFTADGGITSEGSFNLSNVCTVIVDMHDTYGDGWNGASLTLAFNDGTPNQSLTFTSGSDKTYELEINSGTQVTVTFVSGSWNAECSFEIYYEGGEIIYQSSGTPIAGVVTTFICSCGGTASNCDPITNLNAVVNNSNITLTWTGNAVSYIIKRNGVEIGTTTQTSFVDENLSSGEFNYCITAVCDGDLVSVPVCELVINGPTIYQITATAGENGTITPNGVIDVTAGLNQEFVITPNEGYNIEDVLVDGSSVGAVASYTFNNVSGNHSISAIFAIKTFTISATAGANGTIDPEGTVTINYGASQTYTFTPNVNYVIDDVLVDGVSVGSVETYTFENVTDVHTIAVTFKSTESISELSDKYFDVFPNPAATEVNIKGENIANVMVYNALGVLVQNINSELNNLIKIDVSSYNSGVYIVRIITTNGLTVTKRIIIVR